MEAGCGTEVSNECSTTCLQRRPEMATQIECEPGERVSTAGAIGRRQSGAKRRATAARRPARRPARRAARRAAAARRTAVGLASARRWRSRVAVPSQTLPTVPPLVTRCEGRYLLPIRWTTSWRRCRRRSRSSTRHAGPSCRHLPTRLPRRPWPPRWRCHRPRRDLASHRSTAQCGTAKDEYRPRPKTSENVSERRNAWSPE
mmetsp:Transcript_11826/g.37530  ORF Transcript_11826/g.37530 Transcript_11826/m.37530 type:complete len:202 (-) Transcript_11826:147-752(-)